MEIDAIESQLVGASDASLDVADQYSNLGFESQTSGDWAAAVKYHTLARDLYIDTLGASEPEVAEQWTQLGVAFEKQGMLQQSMTAFTAALQMLEQGDVTSQDLLVGDVYTTMGVGCYDRGEHASALTYLDKALNFFKAHDQATSIDIAQCLGAIGLVHEGLGDKQAALSAFQDAITHLQEYKFDGTELDDEVRMVFGTVYNNMGTVYSASGQSDRALEVYELAQEMWHAISTNGGDRQIVNYSLANVHNNLGIIMLEKEKYPQALTHYTKALELFESTDVERANVYHNMALVHEQLGDLQLGVHQRHKAIEVWQEYGDRHSSSIRGEYALIVEALTNMGDLNKAEQLSRMHNLLEEPQPGEDRPTEEGDAQTNDEL